MPIADKFVNVPHPQFQVIPVQGGFSITPNDSTDLPYYTRALYLGGGGNLKVTFIDGSVVTFVGLTSGTDWPWRVARVWATGTTCTNIVGMY